jgi:hypothetical protein
MANKIDFSDATLLGYNQDNYFLGDGIARYGSTRRLSIQVMTHNVSGVGFNNDGVSQSWSGFSGAMASGDNFGEVIVNGYELGSGIVESIAIETDNPVRIGYHRVNIECPHKNADDMHNLSDSGPYIGLRSAVGNNVNRELIRDFSENFSFEEDEDGDYTHQHSVSVRFEEGSSINEIERAKALATTLFAAGNAPDFGYIPGIASFYKTKASDRHYYTESYDLFTKSCSFTKKLKIDGDDAGDYKKKITHSVTLGTNGIVSVTENCEITGKDTYAQATAGMTTEIAAASARCVAVFNSYKDNYLGRYYSGSQTAAANADQDARALNTSGGINNKAISLQKQYFKKKKKVSYSITYNNDPNILDDFIHNYSMSYSEQKNGAITITENGRILPYDTGSKDANFNKPAIRDHYKDDVRPNFQTRARAYYKDLTEEDANAPEETVLKGTSSTISFPREGREISYTKQHSDDLSFRGGYTSAGFNSGTGFPDSTVTVSNSASSNKINKLLVNISDKAPALIRNTYMIPNKEDKYQLIHEPLEGKGKQTNMGKRTVSIKALVAREEGKNVFIDFPTLTTQLDYLKNLAIIKAAEVAIDFKLTKFDWFIESCTYSFNNNRDLDFNLNAVYLTKSTKDYDNVAPTIIDTP